MSKGDTPRPHDKAKFDEGWERTFGPSTRTMTEQVGDLAIRWREIMVDGETVTTQLDDRDPDA